MVRCKGCGRTTSNPKAHNWKKWQLCYSCAKVEHPKFYQNKPNHGTGGSRMHMKIQCESLITKEMNTTRQT